MDLDRLGERFTTNLAAIERLLQDVPPTAAHHKPENRKWSVVEVVCHLADEEREDFRQRVDSTLHRPGQAWPGIDPEGWVTARRYNDRTLDEALADFATERRRSLEWLATLDAPDWDLFYEHPKVGRLRAGDVMASWLAHDLLHLRQLVGLLWIHQRELTAEFDTAYAGNW